MYLDVIKNIISTISSLLTPIIATLALIISIKNRRDTKPNINFILYDFSSYHTNVIYEQNEYNILYLKYSLTNNSSMPVDINGIMINDYMPIYRFFRNQLVINKHCLIPKKLISYILRNNHNYLNMTVNSNISKSLSIIDIDNPESYSMKPYQSVNKINAFKCVKPQSKSPKKFYIDILTSRKSYLYVCEIDFSESIKSHRVRSL